MATASRTPSLSVQVSPYCSSVTTSARPTSAPRSEPSAAKRVEHLLQAPGAGLILFGLRDLPRHLLALRWRKVLERCSHGGIGIQRFGQHRRDLDDPLLGVDPDRHVDLLSD